MGNFMQTGEVQVFDNHMRDEYWYFYESNWGCCRQVNCCTNSTLPWPINNCYTCCEEQRKSPCTYALNHTIVGYRTKNFTVFEALGVLIGPEDRHRGIVFVPRVIHSKWTGKYVMWFENYNQTTVPDPKHPPPGMYAVAQSNSAAGPWTVVRDGPDNAANFTCSGSQGDYDLFTDDDGESYIIITHYSYFCIERLTRDGLGGTGEHSTIQAIDPLIHGHPDGDEAPVMFKRGGLYYVTYASGCCGCKGGSIIWAYWARHPLGPWYLQGTLTPSGPVTKAQQRAVFRVPSPTPAGFIGSLQHYTYIHLGNNWVPDQGGEGTCTNGGLLYWWPLNFSQNGSISDIEWKDEVHFQMLVPP